MSTMKVMRRLGALARKRKPSTTDLRPGRVGASPSSGWGGIGGSRNNEYSAARNVTASIP